ncbi:FAD-dependent oxidoreductase [Mesorhizobium sp. LHD-90]|uniref:FAD-dependent oxidoreductase n=1 Tax=Mesorhizobium sp. LHD-90 TaxID=3071414 RepID=UPI0027DFA34E|nr:FAD-dependent oxidoreductase [Mesorhizobium sp. LHD-90]MDQ6433203.1 FAD-dependent oxidoreductase [Mesorhizobium sp. LHD-90]
MSTTSNTCGTSGKRRPLSGYGGQTYDVVIIGGGVNGGSAAQHLAAEGYSVLMFDKNDFGTGASSRSSRLLHCGLAGLAPSSSVWEFVRNPNKLRAALRSAREMSICRQEFASTMPEYVRQFTFCYPVYEGGPYSGWQMDAAFRMLGWVGAGDIPLDYRRLGKKQFGDIPMLSILHSQDRLRSVATFRECRFEWPERIVMNTVMEAERLGASVRNYTELTRLERKGDGWELVLSDSLDPSTTSVRVGARKVMNFTGAWVDDVNKLAATPSSAQLIQRFKGVHIMVRLPVEHRDHGIFTFIHGHQLFYVVPFRGMHYIGPTEMPFTGSLDEVYATEDDIDVVLANARSILPGLDLKRSDVVYSWAGIEPRTYDKNNPEGTWSRQIHDLSASGMPNVMALTGATIGRSRMSGRDAVTRMRAQLKPRGTPAKLSYTAKKRPHDPNSPPLLSDDVTVRLADIRYAIEEEHAETLSDIMFRRTGLGWNGSMAREGAQVAAQILGECRGWSPERINEEVTRYYDQISRLHGVNAVPAHAPTAG